MTRKGRTVGVAVLILGSIVSCLHAAICLSAGIEGAWERGEMLAFETINDKCATITTVNRTLTVKRAPNNALFATYVADEQRHWAYKNAPECQIPGSGTSPHEFRRLRFWNADIAPSGSAAWSMQAHYTACQGDGCSMNDTLREFSTVLQLHGDTLQEAEPDAAGGALAYKRSEQLRQREEQAAHAFENLMKPLDSGRCNTFVAESLLPDSPIRQYQGVFCQNNARLMGTFPKVTRTSPLIRMSIEKMPSQTGPVYVEDVLIFGFAEFQTGTTAVRTGHLRRVRDRWYIVTHFGI